MFKDIILVLVIQLVYVPLLTLRTIFLVKGITSMASLCAFMECLIYVFGLSVIFNGEKSPIILVIYSLGFALGILLGSFVERKLAIGYTCLTVYLLQLNQELVDTLRNSGYGVTIFEGQGKDNKRYTLEILTKRNCEENLMKAIELFEPKAFIISYEPRKFKGGYLLKSMKKAVEKKRCKKPKESGFFKKIFKKDAHVTCEICKIEDTKK